MKRKPLRNPVTTREANPGIQTDKDGTKLLTCPFCDPPHVLYPDKSSLCGTYIQVKAVQVIIPARTSKKNSITCLKCHKGGGEMVRYMNGFIHLEDCDPQTKFMTEPPKFNKLAGIVFGLPETLRKIVEKQTGEAKQVQEMDSLGSPTGNVLGYLFDKGVGNVQSHP